MPLTSSSRQSHSHTITQICHFTWLPSWTTFHSATGKLFSTNYIISLRSHSTLRRERFQLFTDVSGQPITPKLQGSSTTRRVTYKPGRGKFSTKWRPKTDISQLSIMFNIEIIVLWNVTSSLLTAWCRVLLEKLTGLQLVKKFPAFHGTRRFITALKSVRHLPNPVHIPTSHLVEIRLKIIHPSTPRSP